VSITTVNPATGESLATYEHLTRAETLAVLERVVTAQAVWAQRPVAERAELMRALAALLRERAPVYGELITREMGKTITEAKGEVEKCAWLCEVYAENAAGWLADETVAADGIKHRVVYQPLGVVLSIMPWNYPFWQALRFGVPTLCAGNGSILKHASNVTGCGLAIESAFRDAGFPADLFRTVVADHETVAALVGHDAVRGISLTGSTEAGERIAEQGGRALKKIVLELGGSDPFIVLADADLDVAAREAVRGRLLCAGQSCIAAKRFIVVREVAEAFTERFVERMRAVKVGDPLDPETEMGAIVDAEALAQLLGQLEDAREQGAQVVCGGERLDRPGHFLPPTVVTGVTSEMQIWRDEVFGPIAPIVVAADAQEALRIANASTFGLGGSVWTRDLELGERIARRLEVGCAFVNSITKSDPRMPFGGVKKSGIGRELSWYGLREFCNIKGLNVYEHG
jgi:succinate-semialdehyde dehydrogenase/glutarate-semialdehyde dehydrogenase